MRKRIQQLARGKFEYVRPILSLSTDKIEIEVLEGKNATGDFVIKSTNHVKMRGVIYSSNSRMECLTPQFEGEEVRIRYEFHSDGLSEGDVQKGDFCIICNQGEYNLSFVVSVSKLYADSSVGAIHNLGDFTKLARESWEEAYRLFYSPYFSNLLKEKDARERFIYEGYKKAAPSNQNLEEFLIAIQRKNKIRFSLEKESVSFYEVTTPRKEIVSVKKDQWGYLALRVKSDAAFLVPAKQHLFSDDFMGSVCPFEYYIREDALHAGYNYGRLIFESPYQREILTVCVNREAKKEEIILSTHQQIQESKVRLMKLYLGYRFKKMVTGAWASQSLELLNHLSALEPEQEMYRLMRAQVFLINRQKQEAMWILDSYKRECKDKTTPVWGYYLYLCTLAEREESYVNRLTGEIEVIFREHPESELLFWVLLFLKEGYYNNGARKLKAMERWIMNGADSPYLYFEAFYLIWQDPYLLRKLEKFEILLLRWANRYGMLTREIALQIMELIPSKRIYERRVYELLETCYEVCPEEEMLDVICSYLIRGQCYEEKFHKWYELGISANLRITGLYEAYVMSLDKRKVTEIPKMIQMYFQYQCNMAYQYKSVLYVNIIAAKEKQPEVYQKYRKMMELFAMEQIELGHMDDNLAVIYEEMVSNGILNKELAYALSHIIYTHKLTCLEPGIRRVIVYQKQMKQPQIVLLTDGVAYFQIFSTDFCIFLEDASGNRYLETFPYRLEKLMKTGAYSRRCLELAQDALPYIIYHFDSRKSAATFTEEDKKYFRILLHSEEISGAYRAAMYPEMIRFYQNSEYDSAVERYLDEAEYELLTPNARKYMMELLIEVRHYDKAYEMMQHYGYEELSVTEMVAMCSYQIARLGFEEDDFLSNLVWDTYCKGKYNDVMMMYLARYYNGPTKQMARLWRDAKTFATDCYELEERILTQMMYTMDYIENVEEIYESYCQAGGMEMVRLAYISYFGYYYVVKNMVVPEIFDEIEKRLWEKEELNEPCRLALLKHFSEVPPKTQGENALLEQLLEEFSEKGMIFSFYKKFGQDIVMRYQLYDKKFVEYRTKPGTHVTIHYSVGEQKERFLAEDMTEVYEGIFVKQFVIFFGETIQYYITETDGEKSEITQSNAVTCHDLLGETGESRYHMLNEMLLQKTLDDEEKLKKTMLAYRKTEEAEKQLFRLL